MKFSIRIAPLFWVSALVGSLALFAGIASAETRILFVSDKESGNGTFDLYSMSENGADLKRLTNTPEISEWVPVVSPDGTQIAYTDDSLAEGNILVSPTDFSMRATIVIPGRSTAVQWEDDESLVYIEAVPGPGLPRFILTRTNLFNGTVEPVIGGTYSVFPTGIDGLHVHRDLNRFYFTSTVNGIQGVTILSAPLAGNLPDLTYDHCEDFNAENMSLSLVDHYDATVSPDGRKMAFVADHGRGSHRLYVRTNVTDGCSTQIRLSDTFCGDPAWSTDGTWIAFTRATTSTFGAAPYIGDLVRVNADGTETEVLTADLARVSGRCAHPFVYDTENGATPTPPPFSASIERRGGDIEVVWPSQGEGSLYTLQFSSDLAIWQGLPGAENLTETGVLLTDAFVATDELYFRVVMVSP